MSSFVFCSILVALLLQRAECFGVEAVDWLGAAGVCRHCTHWCM